MGCTRIVLHVPEMDVQTRWWAKANGFEEDLSSWFKFCGKTKDADESNVNNDNVGDKHNQKGSGQGSLSLNNSKQFTSTGLWSEWDEYQQGTSGEWKWQTPWGYDTLIKRIDTLIPSGVVP